MMSALYLVKDARVSHNIQTIRCVGDQRPHRVQPVGLLHGHRAKLKTCLTAEIEPIPEVSLAGRRATFEVRRMYDCTW